MAAFDMFYNIKDFGAAGNGLAKDTRAIQAAIDKCSENGGTVYFPYGKYLTGTIYMRSRVNLKLEAGATIMGSPVLADYSEDTHYNRYDNEPFLDRCLIYSQDLEDIGFEGPGTIDGQGEKFYVENDPFVPHPMLLRFLRCKNIRLIGGFKIRMPAGWSTAFLECEDIFADSLDILSRHANGDGLDFDSCQNVLVTNCKFDTSDDSICLQNSVEGHSCKNIVVTNCIMRSKWAAVRIGLLTSSDIEDVIISNCVFHDTQCSGFKIQSAEGSYIRNMIFQNIVMRNIPRPLFITANHYHMGKNAPADPPRTGGICNLRFENIKAVYSADYKHNPAAGIIIMGIPGHYIKNIDLSGIELISAGGWEDEMLHPDSIPELTNNRPEYYIFKKIPAYGLYARHVKGLRVRDMRLGYDRADKRPPIVLDDVHNSEICGVWAKVEEGTDTVVKLHNAEGIDVRESKAIDNEYNEILGVKMVSH